MKTTRALLAISPFLLGASSCPPRRQAAYEFPILFPSTVTVSEHPIGLSYIRSFGSSQGPGAILKPGRIAAINGDTLAVTDRADCSIVLFSIRTTKVLRRFGHCGDGPGEFRGITALSFAGSDLVAFNQARGSAAVLDTSGREKGIFGITGREPVRMISSLTFLDTSFLAKTVVRSPSTDSTQFYILVGDRATGRVRSGFIPAPEIVAHAHGIMTTIGWCVSKDAAESNVFVAVNQWHPEIGVWKGDLSSPTLRVVRQGRESRPKAMKRRSTFYPRYARVSAACGSHDAIAAFEEVIGGERSKNPRIFRHIHVGFDGVAREVTIAADAPRIGHALVGHGGFFILSGTGAQEGMMHLFSANEEKPLQ
jgi:hypothetical protein